MHLEARGWFLNYSPPYTSRQGLWLQPRTYWYDKSSHPGFPVSVFLSVGIMGRLPLPPSFYIAPGIWTLDLMFTSQVLHTLSYPLSPISIAFILFLYLFLLQMLLIVLWGTACNYLTEILEFSLPYMVDNTTFTTCLSSIPFSKSQVLMSYPHRYFLNYLPSLLHLHLSSSRPTSI